MSSSGSVASLSSGSYSPDLPRRSSSRAAAAGNFDYACEAYNKKHDESEFGDPEARANPYKDEEPVDDVEDDGAPAGGAFSSDESSQFDSSDDEEEDDVSEEDGSIAVLSEDEENAKPPPTNSPRKPTSTSKRTSKRASTKKATVKKGKSTVKKATYKVDGRTTAECRANNATRARKQIAEGRNEVVKAVKRKQQETGTKLQLIENAIKEAATAPWLADSYGPIDICATTGQVNRFYVYSNAMGLLGSQLLFDIKGTVGSMKKKKMKGTDQELADKAHADLFKRWLKGQMSRMDQPFEFEEGSDLRASTPGYKTTGIKLFVVRKSD